MSEAKKKFDKTIVRCNEMVSLYDELKAANADSIISQDILRGAIVLAVAAFDAYATDCFSEYFVFYVKKHGVDTPLEKLLEQAGFTIKFALELINSDRPYRKIRTLIERHYYKYTTQRLNVIDDLFKQYHIMGLTKNAADRSDRHRDTLLKSVAKIIDRRHSIVHDGDYNDHSKIRNVSAGDIKRIKDLEILVNNMEFIINNKMNPNAH